MKIKTWKNENNLRKKSQCKRGFENFRKGLRAEQEAGLYLIDQGVRLLAWRSRNRHSEVDWIGIQEKRLPPLTASEKDTGLRVSGLGHGSSKGDGPKYESKDSQCVLWQKSASRPALIFFEVKVCRFEQEGFLRVNRRKIQKIQKHILWFVNRFPEYENYEKRIEVIVGVPRHHLLHSPQLISQTPVSTDRDKLENSLLKEDAEAEGLEMTWAWTRRECEPLSY